MEFKKNIIIDCVSIFQHFIILHYINIMSKVLKFSDIVIEDLSYENPTNNATFEYLASESTGKMIFRLPEMKV